MRSTLVFLATLGLAFALAAQPAPSSKGGAAAKGEKEPPKIEGIAVARPGGGYFGIQIEGGNFKMTFYDVDKLPTPPDVARAILRWDPKYKKVGQERVALTPGGENMLSSPRAIRPPYNFRLFILLFKDPANDESDSKPSEQHVIDFRQ